MIFWLTIAALILFSAVLCKRYDEKIYNTAPVALSLLMLAMYALAFIRGLWLIGLVSLGYIVVRMFLAFKRHEVRELLSKVPGIELGVLAIFLFAVRLLTKDMVINWWDDINFWSSDVKQLFYLGGFPGKYGNVSPEFGDYPPAGSLIKWLFMRLSSCYDESLQFFGYFAMNLVFLLPLYGAVKKGIMKRFGTSAAASGGGVEASMGNGSAKASQGAAALKSAKIAAIALIAVSYVAIVLFPGVFSDIVYYGTPADITMGIVYGLLLYFIYDFRGCNTGFYHLRIFAMTSMLLLTKSVGIEWAIFAFVFYLIINKDKKREMVPAVIGSGVVYGSWLGFCFLNRRVAKLTGAGIKMATSGDYTAPPNASDKAKFFMQGFWSMPVHADRNLTFDISMGVLVILIFAAIVLMGVFKILEKKETAKIAIFMGITALLTYGIIFAAHITIFMTEDQYLDAFAMARSIARYGCPFALGGVYLLFCIFYNKLKENSHAVLCGLFAAFVLLTANYVGFFGFLFDHKEAMLENSAYVSEMVGDDGRVLADKVLSDKNLWGKRVLVMRDGHTYHWVHNAYISKEASPVALVYDDFIAEEENTDAMVRKIVESHASYLYIEDDDKLSEALFTPLLTDGTGFESRRVYRLEYSGGAVRLK